MSIRGSIHGRLVTAGLSITAALIVPVLGPGTVTIAVATAAPALRAPTVATPTPAQLKAKLHILLDTNAPRAARAAELEAGEAELDAVDPIKKAIDAAGPNMGWDIIGPVTTDGDILHATLQTTYPGYEPWTFPLTWRNVDGVWKLTNESACTIYGIAMLPCPAS